MVSKEKGGCIGSENTNLKKIGRENFEKNTPKPTKV